MSKNKKEEMIEQQNVQGGVQKAIDLKKAWSKTTLAIAFSR